VESAFDPPFDCNRPSRTPRASCAKTQAGTRCLRTASTRANDRDGPRWYWGTRCDSGPLCPQTAMRSCRPVKRALAHGGLDVIVRRVAISGLRRPPRIAGQRTVPSAARTLEMLLEKRRAGGDAPFVPYRHQKTEARHECATSPRRLNDGREGDGRIRESPAALSAAAKPFADHDCGGISRTGKYESPRIAPRMQCNQPVALRQPRASVTTRNRSTFTP